MATSRWKKWLKWPEKEIKMGNDQEQKLRQVNIRTEQMSPISESINTRSSSLAQLEEIDQNIQITSPIMKKLANLSSSIPQGDPTKEIVKQAHEDAEMTLDTMKHPRRVSRAKAKRQEQAKIVKIAQDNAQIARPNFGTDDQLYQDLKSMDVSKLMFDKAGDTGYEKLLHEKKKKGGGVESTYKELKTAFTLIGDYERVVNAAEADKINQNSLTDKDKDEFRLMRAKIKTIQDIRAYYEIHESIMRNKYYSMLPHKDMHSLSYNELRKRLDRLYQVPPKQAGQAQQQNQAVRNEELIDYYQNLIRLKEIGLTDEKSAKARVGEYDAAMSVNVQREDKRKPKDEMKKMTKAYVKMMEMLDDPKSILTVNTKLLYQKQLFEAFKDDLDKFRPAQAKGDQQKLLAAYDHYKQHKADYDQPNELRNLLRNIGMPEGEKEIKEDDGRQTEGIQLTDEQKKGVRLIGAYILRHSVTDFSKRMHFAQNLLQAKPEQQLIIFYLMENKKQDISMGVDFYSALHNYVPDLDRFRDNMDWTTLSRAMRASVPIHEQMVKYGLLESAITQSEAQLQNEEKEPVSDQNADAKRQTIIQALAQRGMLLRMLYRNAGLHDDMPPDMAADPVLRKRMFKEYKAMAELVRKLQAVNQASPPQQPSQMPDYKGQNVRDDSEGPPREEESEGGIDVEKWAGRFHEYVLEDVAAGFDNCANALSGIWDVSKDMIEKSGYGHFSGWLGGVTGVFSFILACANAHSIRVDNTISAAARTAQAFSVSNSFFGSVGEMIGGVNTLIETAFDAGTVNGLAQTGGAFAVVAGTLQMVSSGIEIGRAFSSKNDIKRARAAMSNAPQDVDQKRLDRFLTHQSRESTAQIVSAGFGMAAGLMNILAGGLLMGGPALAPVAAVFSVIGIGIGIAGKITDKVARHKLRKKAVDDLLQVDRLTDEVIARRATSKMAFKNLSDKEVAKIRDKIREQVREEALSMLGFNSDAECFRYLCQEYTDLLYNKVFIKRPADREMYLDAMKSLGLKIVDPGANQSGYKPTREAMLTKMMAG